MSTIFAPARKGSARPHLPENAAPQSLEHSLEQSALWAILSGINTASPAPHHPLLQRLFDVTVSALLLLLLAPLLSIIWLRLLQTGVAPLYRHARIGRHGKRFTCLKFSTMHPDSDEVLRRHLRDNPLARLQWETYRKLRNDPRVTPFGRFLRRTSFDELPQLWNVLRGEMSIVGPRPILPHESQSYGSALAIYQSVRPGLTGLWQVSGRSKLGFRERVMLDMLHICNRTFWLDLMILIKTIGVVIRGNGAW